MTMLAPGLRPAVAAMILVAAGCGLVPNDPPVDEPQLVSDCEPPFAFEGETTIAELELESATQALGAQARQRGIIRITRDTVTHEQFAPPGAPVIVPEGQMLCATWEDGSGLSMLLDERFPAGVALEDVAEATDDRPIAPWLVGLAVVLIGAVSWIAFTRSATPPGS